MEQLTIPLLENRTVTTSSAYNVKALTDDNTYRNTLIEKDKLIFFLKSVNGTIPTGSTVIINYYSKRLGLLGSETLTFGEVTTYARSEATSQTLLNDADWFTVEINLVQAVGASYTASVIVEVTSRSAGVNLQDALENGKKYARKDAEWTEVLHSTFADKDLAGNHAKLIPSANSVTGLQITKANGTTVIVNVDSTNEFVGIGSVAPTSKLQVVGLPEYADNATAVTGGLTVGAFYHTAGALKVVTA